MKKLLFSIIISMLALSSFGQDWWELNFDNSWYNDRIVRDTTTNPNCLWRVGQPSKTTFTSAYSPPNAIVTDLLNPVPANDTSVFYLKHVRDNLFPPYHVFVLQFWYQMQGDTTDFGIIEISPDAGLNWINVLTEDEVYQMAWYSSKPSLNGSTNGWQHFNLDMTTWASGWGIFPIPMTADTILFRFTYITDSDSAPNDGWMIDNFVLEDWWEGIEEVQYDNLISVSPNPASDELIIQTSKFPSKQSVQIIDYAGKVLYNFHDFVGNTIDIRHLPNGLYLLKYSDTENFSIKKFIVQH